MSKIKSDYLAHKEVFEQVTEFDTYQLLCCDHHWCKNQNSLDHANEILSSCITFIKHLMKLLKSEQPSQSQAKRYMILAVGDALI